MLTPREPTREGLRAYLDELRPRVLVLRVRAGRVRFAWAAPLWPFGEVLSFAAGVVLLARALLAAWARRGGRLPQSLAEATAFAGTGAVGDATPSPLAALDALAGARFGDRLRLPPGEPYLRVRTPEASVELTTY